MATSSSSDPFALPNRLLVRNKLGPVLVAEVHPSVPQASLPALLHAWKRRNRAFARPVNLLFDPFGVYFHVTSVPVAWRNGQPVLHLGFGDASDPNEAPHDLLVGGTRFLLRLAGWYDVEAAKLLGHAKSWFERVGGDPHPYLPACPGTPGIARAWLAALLARPVEVSVELGLGAPPAEPPHPHHATLPPEAISNPAESTGTRARFPNAS